MLVLDGGLRDGTRDRHVRDLPGYLRAGDLLVLNDTRVMPARVLGLKPSGGRVEILLERALRANEALAQLSASKAIREGLRISTAGGPVQVIAREQGMWRIALPQPALEFFQRWGASPAAALHPPRARSRLIASATRASSRASPEQWPRPPRVCISMRNSAAALSARGVERAFVTLHVGAGTFQPVRVEELSAHTMHAEYAAVSAETCAAIARARAAGGRIVAVGTTVVRALESAALAGGDTDACAVDRGHAAVHHTRASGSASAICC